MPTWLSWLLLVAGLMLLFVAWDVIFCGGERCMHLLERTPLRSLLGRNRPGPRRRSP